MNAAARLPGVDRVLSTPLLRALAAEHGPTAATAAVRAVLDALRPAALAGQASAEQLTPEAVAAQAQQHLAARFAPRLKAVFNLTGTVLHTNLGRALLPDAAVQAVVQALTTPANLEFDLETGGRGDRTMADFISAQSRQRAGERHVDVEIMPLECVDILRRAIDHHHSGHGRSPCFRQAKDDAAGTNGSRPS